MSTTQRATTDSLEKLVSSRKEAHAISHAKRCLLSAHCTLAGTPSCNATCSPYIAIHGFSGSGGRSGASGLPSDYRLTTLANSPARADQAEVYGIADEYSKTFTRMFDADKPETPRIKSLYLFSESPGTGKTTTAAALLNEWLTVAYIGSVRRGRHLPERPAYFLDVNAWQTLFLGFNRSNVPQATAEPLASEYYAMEARAKTAPFAVLDDIGVRSASEAFRADLHGIINHRVANELPSVYTSNVAMRDLALVFDARLADRIRDMTAEITFSGGSKRGFRT